MDPQTQNAGAPVAKTEPDNPLAVTSPGEQVVCEIRRHPIGIIGTYVSAGLLLVLVAILTFVLAPHIFSGKSTGQMTSISLLIFIVAAVIICLYVFIAHKVYWGNRWIVTNDSITQVRQTSLFDKQTSQLSLADLEDLTAEQDGPVAQMFHFGVISAETAAATDKFTFPFCPNPNDYAKQILATREQFDAARRHDTGTQAQTSSTTTGESTTSSPPPAAA